MSVKERVYLLWAIGTVVPLFCSRNYIIFKPTRDIYEEIDVVYSRISCYVFIK